MTTPRVSTHADTATPMRAMWVLVTPEMALRWLDGNTGNRRIRAKVLARYVNDMRHGRWTPNSTAISIATNGRILNGQHRLTAVMQSGATVGMWVMTGMPEDSYVNEDRGAGRTYADQIRSQVGAESIVLAAALGKAVPFSRGISPVTGKWVTHDGGTPDSHRDDYLVLNPGILYSAQMWGTSEAKAGASCPAAVLVFAHHLIAKAAGHASADMFMHQLVTQDREPNPGTIHLCKKLLGSVKGRDLDPRRLALILAAWNHWAAGREVTTTLRLGDDFQKSLPKIATRVTR